MTEPDHKTVEASPIVVTVVGSGAEVGESGKLIKTPKGQADFITHVVHPIRALTIRFLHRFVDAVIGAEGLQAIDSMAGWNLIPGSAIKVAVFFALTTAVWGLLRDLGTVLTRLEGKFPLSTGNV